MLHIETIGCWRAMGRQIGETFPDRFEQVAERFAPWRRRDSGARGSAIDAVFATLAEHVPHLMEETAGMAARKRHLAPGTVPGECVWVRECVGM